jgi:hypothetical protein
LENGGISLLVQDFLMVEAKKFPNVTLAATVIGQAESMPAIATDSVDIVVSE